MRNIHLISLLSQSDLAFYAVRSKVAHGVIIEDTDNFRSSTGELSTTFPTDRNGMSDGGYQRCLVRRTCGHVPFGRTAIARGRTSSEADLHAKWPERTFSISSKHSESPGMGATPATCPDMRRIAVTAGPADTSVSPNKVPKKTDASERRKVSGVPLLGDGDEDSLMI